MKVCTQVSMKVYKQDLRMYKVYTQVSMKVNKQDKRM